MKIRHNSNNFFFFSIFYHPWNVVNGKEDRQEEGDVKTFNGQTLRGMECMPSFFLFKGTVSFQLAAVRLLYVDVRNSNYQLHLFTIKLFAQLYDKGHNGFTHSQCTSLQSKVGGTLYKEKMVRLVFSFFYTLFFFPQTFQIHSRALWLVKEHFEILSFLRSMHKKKPLNTTYQFSLLLS